MEPFWYDDFTVLYDFKYITKFYPSKFFTTEEKLNAAVRFCIYFSFLLVLYKGNTNFLYIPILALGITYYLWKNREKAKELFNGSYLDNDLQPTYDNPFMNPNLVVQDPKTFLKKQNKVVRFDVNHHIPDKNDLEKNGQVEDKFSARLYQSVGDVFEKENSQRQFYSVPARTYPNDQTAFAQWCYGTPKACKAGDNDACLQYNNDLRSNAQLDSIKLPGPSSVQLRKDWY